VQRKAVNVRNAKDVPTVPKSVKRRNLMSSLNYVNSVMKTIVLLLILVLNVLSAERMIPRNVINAETIRKDVNTRNVIIGSVLYVLILNQWDVMIVY
jgi:hypothetical protein